MLLALSLNSKRVYRKKADFGSDMSSFGSYFASYYASISNVDVGQLSGVIDETNNLVKMAKGMNELDTSGMSGFAESLVALGNNGIDGFVSAFTNSHSRVVEAASAMLNAFVKGANAKKPTLTTTFTSLVQSVLTAMNSKQQMFMTTGSTFMIRFITGVSSQDANARATFINIVNACLIIMQSRTAEFEMVGRQQMARFIFGLSVESGAANKVFISTLSNMLGTIRSYEGEFHSAGAHLVNGFANGINANTYKAAATARAMARAASDAAKKELDEHSPSKVGYEIGDFFGVAFVNAIATYGKKAYDTSKNMASMAKTGLTTGIEAIAEWMDSDADLQPTIRPLLDLSEVEKEAMRLDTMFAYEQAVAAGSGINNKSKSTDEHQNGADGATRGNSFTFTQNNYSPKALSRVEIYRQTRNQISQMKGLVTP